MRRVSLAEAKDNLSELVEEAAAGEPVDILVGGKVVARITSVEPSPISPRPPLDVDRLVKHLEAMTLQTESAGDFVRRMRDEDRY